MKSFKILKINETLRICRQQSTFIGSVIVNQPMEDVGHHQVIVQVSMELETHARNI